MGIRESAIIYGCFFLEKGGIIDIIFSNMCGIMGVVLGKCDKKIGKKSKGYAKVV